MTHQRLIDVGGYRLALRVAGRGSPADFSWDPISGCTDQGIADRRAWALVRGSGGASGVDRADFWAGKAQEILRCYLLAAGALGRWCAATLTGTPHAAAQVATAAASARPLWPRRVADYGHWATIGGALGGAPRAATRFRHPARPAPTTPSSARTAPGSPTPPASSVPPPSPTHAGLDPARAVRANPLRPLPGGRWLDLDAHHRGDDHGVEPGPTTPHADGVVGNLITRLIAYLAEHAPPGGLARSRGAEAVLARACVVLTDWETAYRTGRLPDHTAPALLRPQVMGVLGLVDGAVPCREPG